MKGQDVTPFKLGEVKACEKTGDGSNQNATTAHLDVVTNSATRVRVSILLHW